MAEPIHQLGNNTELDEDSNGDTILRNTSNGNSVKLSTIIELLGSDTSLEDDTKLFFGTDDDWSIRFDSSATELVVRDENGSNDVATVDSSGITTDALEADTVGSGGGLTTTDITNLEGPGIHVDSANNLTVDASIPSDVSSSRSFGTWETNNFGNPLIVQVSGFVGSADHNDGDIVRLAGDVNSSQVTNSFGGDRTAQGDGSNNLVNGLTLFVPDGAEYQVRVVTDESGSFALAKWVEFQFGSG